MTSQRCCLFSWLYIRFDFPLKLPLNENGACLYRLSTTYLLIDTRQKMIGQLSNDGHRLTARNCPPSAMYQLEWIDRTTGILIHQINEFTIQSLDPWRCVTSEHIAVIAILSIPVFPRSRFTGRCRWQVNTGSGKCLMPSHYLDQRWPNSMT